MLSALVLDSICECNSVIHCQFKRVKKIPYYSGSSFLSDKKEISSERRGGKTDVAFPCLDLLNLFSPLNANNLFSPLALSEEKAVG